MRLEFFVPGRPIPQGSSKAFVITPRATGRPRAVVTHDNPQTRPWREAIGYAARQVMRQTKTVLMTGPVHINLLFIFPRPKRLPAKHLSPYMITRPDLDKLVRACLDAMSGIVFSDDAQIVRLSAGKRYMYPDVEPSPGVEIRVW